MQEICTKCLGVKTYRGMGCMVVKCEVCKGTGSCAVKEPKLLIDALKKTKKTKVGKNDEKISKTAQS